MRPLQLRELHLSYLLMSNGEGAFLLAGYLGESPSFQDSKENIFLVIVGR